jgi:formimidoylglutamate deiminase
MQWETPRQLFARSALTSEGWQNNVLLEISSSGTITSITPGSLAPSGVATHPLLLAGMANVHSHAFQRAMAGLTEIASGAGNDNFWSWRQVMYLFKQRLTPQHVEIIAQHLYIELLKQGYTAVGEFHYLHNDASGKPYANPIELSERILAAGKASGIHVSLLPVYYETSNFGGMAANDGQKRFTHRLDDFITLLTALKAKEDTGMNLGIAPHSLRAVSEPSLKALLAALPALGMDNSPVHIHVSEQVKEVDDCIAWSGKRPVQWLLDNAPVNSNWCLIHATHSNPDEVARIAQSKAVVGLCPTTEANLGDGIFPGADFLHHQGRIGIGSDSNVCVSPFEELRQMEYAQRLITKRRTVLCDEKTPSVGRSLYTRAANGGAQAIGLQSGALAVGKRADIIAINTDTPLLADKQEDKLLDTLIMVSQTPPVTHVWVAGNCVVENGHHRLEEQTSTAWKKALKEITA